MQRLKNIKPTKSSDPPSTSSQPISGPASPASPPSRNGRNDDINHHDNAISRQRTRSSQRKPPKWWRIYLFRGMWRDIKHRAPYYLSDFTDAWDYRVVPATIYIFFANILPALAFSLDMFDRTHNSYGVNEVLLSTVLAAVVFSLFAAQPLTIVGVTGPITVFSYTVYDIMVPTGSNFFAFMALVGLWAMVMHFFLAITNSCNALKYVTRFSCDTFGFYVALIYLQKGVQVLTRQFNESSASAYLSIMIALLVLMVAYGCGILGESTLLHRYVRKFIEDYGTPLTIVFFTGFVHIGHMAEVPLQKLPTSKAFFPTADRGWFVDFWEVRPRDVGIAFPFAIILTILFWFDHNVSSLIAQGTEFPLRKPAGFHWDIFLLGITTGVAGLLGIPFPNGLIPQAPFHTASLCVTRQVRVERDQSYASEEPSATTTKRVVDHVVEQRASNFIQGLATVGLMTGPLLIVLGLVPQGVLAGLFFTMGAQALTSNGIVLKIMYIFRAREFNVSDPLHKLERQYMIAAFVAVELLFFAVAFAITQTIAAIGFPIVLILPIPFRVWVMPRFWRKEELAALDAPTASAFTMESVGGVSGSVGSPLDAAADVAQERGDDDNNNDDAVAESRATGRDPEKGELEQRRVGAQGDAQDELSTETGGFGGVGSDPYKL